MSCKVRECNWRCLECIGGAYECSGCFRDRHRLLPFHRVEHWTGTHFKPAWLCQVGVEIHLGHHGNPCPSRGDARPSRADSRSGTGGADTGSGSGSGRAEASSGLAHSFDREEDPFTLSDEEDDFGVSDDEVDDLMEDVTGDHGLPGLIGEDVCVLIDKSGVHRLRVRPCTCKSNLPLDLQFMDMRLFPASLKRIRTAFTFGVLDDFRMDNLECKTAGLRYFNKLRRLTSNAFPHTVPVGPGLSIGEQVWFIDFLGFQDRYRELLRTSRLWRNMKYRKWHGFGHEPDRSPGPGELAIFCAACPQPGVNLPEGWENDPER
jgi:hypothetical protein